MWAFEYKKKEKEKKGNKNDKLVVYLVGEAPT